MNLTKIKLGFIGICGLILLPAVTHASSATLLGDDSVLFTIDFSFTDDTFAVSVPLLAEFGVSYLDRVNSVGYTVEAADAAVEVSSMSAVVLSRSPFDGTNYTVPVGETGNFTLLILATFAKPITAEYRAYITKLPYYLNERRTTVHQNQLDELDRPTLKQF